MAEAVTLTAQDVELVKGWVTSQRATMPAEVWRIMERMLRVLTVLETLIARHKKLMKAFQEAMGLTPKSERGGALSNQ